MKETLGKTPFFYSREGRLELICASGFSSRYCKPGHSWGPCSHTNSNFTTIIINPHNPSTKPS